MEKNVLYIHGFNSSPMSAKALLTKTYFKTHFPEVGFYCPQVASTPNKALEQLTTIVESKPSAKWYFIGSSLGGYFSTYLSEKFQAPAVLVNPAVTPYKLLTDYLGVQQNPYTNELFNVTEGFVADLKALEQVIITEKNYLVMVQTHDEVLNYQEAASKYQNCQLILQQGGDHSFVDFDKMLPTIVKFFQLS